MSAELSAISRDAMDTGGTYSIQNPISTNAVPTVSTPPIGPTPPVVSSIDWKSNFKSFYKSWFFQYVAIFVGVVIMLYVMQPPFVLSEIPPHQLNNPSYVPGCSFRSVMIVATASVAAAAVAPLLYRNWGMVSSSAKNAAQTVKTIVQN
jgi:hypothetical protein